MCEVALLPPGTPWTLVQYMLPVVCFPHHVHSCCADVYYVCVVCVCTGLCPRRFGDAPMQCDLSLLVTLQALS